MNFEAKFRVLPLGAELAGTGRNWRRRGQGGCAATGQGQGGHGGLRRHKATGAMAA